MSVQNIGAILQNIHCTTLADLSGYQFASVGYKAYVDQLKRSFTAIPANTFTADGYSVLDGYNVQWKSSNTFHINRTIYIDGYAPVGGDGSLEMPFKTFAAATSGASLDAIFVVSPGTYTEDIHITGKQEIICAIQDTNNSAFGTSYNNWPIKINGDIYITFPQQLSISIADISCNDVYISATTPGTANILLTLRCWVRDFIPSNNIFIKIVGSTNPNNANFTNSIFRRATGNILDISVENSNLGIDKNNTFITNSIDVSSFQLLNCYLISSIQTAITTTNYSTINNSVMIYNTNSSLPININFTTSNKFVVISGTINQKITVSGTNAYIKYSSSQAQFHLTNLSQLATYASVLGVNAYIDTQKCCYTSVPIGQGEVLGNHDSAGSGQLACDWKRDLSTSSPTWLSQNTWYIDGYAGNDENDGYTSVTPLQTCDEIQRRLGTNPKLSQATAINILTPASIYLNIGRTSSLAQLTITAIPTINTTITVSSYTNKNMAGNEWNILDAGSVFDWTPYIGCRLYFRTGNAYAWVEKVNPAGGGVKTARITSCYKLPTANIDFISPTRYLPVNGETVEIQTLLSLPSIYINYDDAVTGDYQASSIATNRELTLYGLKSDVEPIINSGHWPGSVAFIGCDFLTPKTPKRYPFIYYHSTRTRLNASLPFGTIYGGSIVGTNSIMYSIDAAATISFLIDVLGQGCGFGALIDTSLSLQECGSFDSIYGLWSYDHATIYINLSFCGKGHSNYGVNMYQTSKIIYNGTKPTVTGANGDIQVNSVGNFLWSDVPRSFNHFAGTATLSSGTITVASKNMPTDAKITISRNTPSGGLGDLSIPSATRTNLGTATSQFIINSSSNSDNSTIDWEWFSPTIGNGNIFQH